MTEKQAKILAAALELFANEGFAATSTNKVAKKAGVSEGLIFRHFTNKEGLLEAILREGEEKAKFLFADVVFETDPKKILRHTLALYTKMADSVEESTFWKLQYKIKWEVEVYGEHKMEALEHALVKAFTELNYENPEMEASMLLVTMDGLATRHYLQKGFDLKSALAFLHLKYKL